MSLDIVVEWRRLVQPSRSFTVGDWYKHENIRLTHNCVWNRTAKSSEKDFGEVSVNAYAWHRHLVWHWMNDLQRCNVENIDAIVVRNKNDTRFSGQVHIFTRIASNTFHRQLNIRMHGIQISKNRNSTVWIYSRDVGAAIIEMIVKTKREWIWVNWSNLLSASVYAWVGSRTGSQWLSQVR
jgi:hypothetical protein